MAFSASTRPENRERCNVDADTEEHRQSKREGNAYQKCEVGAALGSLRSSRQYVLSAARIFKPLNLSKLLITPFAFEPAATVIGAADT